MTVVQKIQQNIIKYVRLVHDIWTLCPSRPISILVGKKQCQKSNMSKLIVFQKQKPESTWKTRPDLTAIRTYFTRWLNRTNSYDLTHTNSYDFANRTYFTSANSYEFVRMTYT